MKNSHMPAGIYLHIPFCVRKCNYCDFYSLPQPEKGIMERYTSSLIKELQARASRWEEQEFSTIYLGGGTPSLLKSVQIEKIIKAICANYNLVDNPEISMEANPATLSSQSLQEIQTAGINRLSLGAQSFRDDELMLLGRMHGVQQIVDTVQAVEKAGINNFNLDLIYGIPGQSLQDWMENLRMAVQCHPQHISVYLLQLEPSTPLAQRIQWGELPATDEDLEVSMYYSSIDYLRTEGYQQYEISNFAKAGYECRHNQIYWQAHEYLGLGAGAVSYRNGQRTMNKADLNAYLDRIDKASTCEIEILETMTEAEKLRDAVILGLRMSSGIKPSELLQRFGIDFEREYHAIIEKLVQEGLLMVEKDHICLSRLGYFLSNQVFCQFV